MLLVLDVGNTNTVLGVFAKSLTDSAPPPRYDKLVANWRVTTRAAQTVDEYGVLFRNLFSMEGLEPKDIGGIVVSSVVPPLDSTLRRVCERYFGRKPLFIEQTRRNVESSGGTTEETTIPPMSFGSNPSIENKFLKRTPYSSTVCAARVVTRQFATSLSYLGGGAESVRDFANTPSTVLVLPTSRTRSMVRQWSVASGQWLVVSG